MRRPWSALSFLVVAAACSDRTVSGPVSLSTTFDRAESSSGSGDIVGGVFTETDDSTNNSVVAFARHADGSLTYIANYPTGGKGLGGNNVVDPLQSQFAVTLTPDHRYLFAVNAGSSSIAAFAVSKSGLHIIGTVASNGSGTVSLAATNHVLYALNKYSNTITGFRIDDGRLTLVPALARSLSTGAGGGAAIRFDREQRLLAVTERTSNTIDVFDVHEGRLATHPVTSATAGVTPFGFDWTPRQQLIASEAGSGSASSYDVVNGARLSVVSGRVSTNQAAPCWLITTHDGRFAYVANAGSGSVTGFAVSATGALSILSPSGVTGALGAGSTPLDLDVSQDSKFLYVLKAGANTVGTFAVGHDGSLSNLADGVGGIPTKSGQMGIAAY